MRKTYYDATTVDALLAALEEHFGLPSDEFYELHVADGPLPAELSRFDRHVWASFYRERAAAADSSFAAHAERLLATA